VLVDVLSLTLFQLAFGLAVFELLTPSRDLSSGFFVLHGALALPAAVLAGLSSGLSGLLLRGKGGLPLFVVFTVGVGLHTLCARMEWMGAARLALVPSVLAGGALLGSLAHVEPFVGRGIGPVWLASGLGLGGLFFGAVVWAMNLGHWYLVSKTLPYQLLLWGSSAFAFLAVARSALAVVALGFVARSTAPGPLDLLLDPMRDGLFFWSRVLWGLFAPLVLAPFVVKTAQMRSNQAATGLLYVGLVFVMIGELLATYLTLRSGLPV